jgi:tetratricopeptide (TPR) repeat protein
MRGTLNLAVADFASADSRGGQASEATAKLATDVATSLADLLGQQLRPLADELRIEIRGPAKFPQITGESRIARAQTANQRAAEIDADIVVYGMLTTDGNTTILQPQLYLSDSIHGDAGETVGEHLWGSPIPLAGSPESHQLAIKEFGQPLIGRSKAMASLILGIWYYQADQPRTALRHLHASAENPEWPDETGKELVYLFLGNAQARQAQQQRQQHPDAARQSFGKAVGYYNRVLKADTQSARAWYGKAEAQFLQVGIECQPNRIDRRLLAQVVRDLKRGQRATHRPALANLDAKLAFGLGRAYVCMTLAGIADQRAEAHEQLRLAIAAYQPASPEDPSTRRLRRIAAEAYAQRGLIAVAYAGARDTRARDLRVVEDYGKAIALSADRPERQAVFYDRLAETYDRLQMLREAQEARSKARTLAPTRPTASG